MNENEGLFVSEDGFVSDDVGEVDSSDGGDSLGIHVIPTAGSVEIHSAHEASEERSGESEEKEVMKIQSPVLKKRRKKKQVKKKKVVVEQKEDTPVQKTKKEKKKKSLVDEILSREYWRKKKRKERRKRREKMKKLEEKKVVVVKSPPPKKPSPKKAKDILPIPDQYDRKGILDGEVRGWNADDESIEVLNQKIKEVLEEKGDQEEMVGEKEIEEEDEKGEEIKEETEIAVADDQVWDVADGIFRDGEEFFDVEARTKNLLKEIDNESILKELSLDDENSGNNDEGGGMMIDNQELTKIENELNEIFGIEPEEPEEVVEDKKPKPKKKRRKKRKKMVYKTVLDEILSPGYWNRKKGKKGKRGGKKNLSKKKGKTK